MACEIVRRISENVKAYQGHIGGFVHDHRCSDHCRDAVSIYHGVFDKFQSLKCDVDLSMGNG